MGELPDGSLIVRIPVTAINRYKQFVENSPEVEALLRHVATIDDGKERLRMLHQFRSRFIQYDSDTFPLEAKWYIEDELLKRTASPCVLFEQLAYMQTTFTLFSYTSNEDGLLKRHHISILVEENNASEFQTAMTLREKLIILGANSAVVTNPEVRWNSINVVLNTTKSSWRWYLVKLYSVKLLHHAMHREIFNFKDIGKYEIKPELKPLHLCIYHISKLF